MIIRGIDRLFINVPDLDKAIDFYHGDVGMDVVASGSLDQVMLGDLWGLDGNVTGRSACVKNAKQATAIELVELKPTPQESIRDGANTYDYGYFDVCYLVSSADKVEREFKSKGYRFYSDTYRYPTWPEGEEASEAFIYGPAREMVGIVELFNPPVTEDQKLDSDFWTILDMAQVVDSMEEALRFYGDALGLTLISDNAKLPPGFLDEVLHLPSGTRARIAMFNHPQSNGPTVELLETSAKGKALISSPKKLGIFMMAFESDNIQGEIEKVKGQGFKVISGPVEIQANLHGKLKAAHIEGPNKIRVELFQKV